MNPIGDKSLSESAIDQIGMEMEQITPPNYVALRNKRRREDDTNVDRFDVFREEIKTLILTMFKSQESGSKKLESTLTEISKTNTNIQTTMSFLAEQNVELKKKLELLEIERKKDKEHISILEGQLEDLKRDRLKNNIEIKNAPKADKETKEDLIIMTLELAKSVNCQLSEKDINDIYRIRFKREGNASSPIIVELSTTLLKMKFLQACKTYNLKNKDKLRAKHLGLKSQGQENIPVYVAEQLTASRARLYFLARDLMRSKSYKFCWTSYGRVYVRKSENSPIITINNEAIVQKLLGEQ
ncbi:uncharacterized protein LOC125062012 [Pieris napi]|uniref:FP protein C-terminal domain-containing protein n=1 Tax=Pieris macdunnoughi TaxID=345717 RepID=A0A821RI74_9NEOP|nr:uncharacterized protein LOC125062012 [Pieris napi]CAF4841969.1 unnamed protein product [Pieris macdunnoughi]